MPSGQNSQVRVIARRYLRIAREAVLLNVWLLWAALLAAQSIAPGENVCVGPSTPKNNLAARRWRSEQKLGANLAQDAESHFTLVTDTVITQYLNRLESRVVLHASWGHCFTVKMINDIEPNAYSLPGGFIYITSGLILMSDNEAQLAAALAHETGHVTARHYSKINRQRQFWGALSLFGSPVGYLLRRSLGPLLTSKLLRSAEFEADGLGATYLAAAGYDQNEFRDLLRRAFAEDQQPSSFGQRLLDTHPSLLERTKHLNSTRHTLPATGADSTVDTSEFHEMKQRTAALLKLSNPDPFQLDKP